MAELTSTKEVKFTNNELWCAMEHQVMDLVSDRAIQYLTKEAVYFHVNEAIDKVFYEIESLVKDDGEQAH